MKTSNAVMHAVSTLTHVVYEGENWSLALREGGVGTVSENGVLRREMEPYRLDVTGGWKKLHSEELGNLPDIIKE
jgi:hypothetical protein